jgi:GT2 family glycosyltransferase/glycosyltransferase involved in cell wall biosynthesis
MADQTRRDAQGDAQGVFDAEWYLTKYPDVATAGVDPLDHYINYGAAELRDPNPFFDSRWYLAQNPDLAGSGMHPLVHYMQFGAAELRNPHPRFDAAFYVEQHPEAAGNPLLAHLATGVGQGWATEHALDLGGCLPSAETSPGCPAEVRVDVIIPAYRGLEQTQRCVESVLADPERPPGRIIVIDDCSPEPRLSAWLDELNDTGRIRLIRNPRNQGFVASVNRGVKAADRSDVVLLNSDTVVPRGWLARLAGHAYASPRVGSISPFSNNATICSYPADAGGPMPLGAELATLDSLCLATNCGRTVEVPTTVGFCMYIRRACIDEVGLFDVETFGRGYGEENDFCLRATKLGWRHLLACDTFVYHEGSVSFGVDSADLAGKFELLTTRYPDFPERVARHVRRDLVGPFRFALTAALFVRSGLPTLLFVSHSMGGGVRQHVASLVDRLAGAANVLLLSATARGATLSVPALPGHSELEWRDDQMPELLSYLESAKVSRVHVHHVVGMRFDLRGLIRRLGVPFDLTVHDYYAICPQINLLPQRNGHYCGEPGTAGCNTCIAERPESGARDILAWRLAHAWLLQEADRVICPSEDARARLARYGLDDRGVAVWHEPVRRSAWPLRPLPPPDGDTPEPLRVALLGVLAPHKGVWRLEEVAERADPEAFAFHIIGYAEEKLSPRAAEQVRETGEYEASELPGLIETLRPHVVWFPAQWPETYSYTLSAAIDAGLPIVAADIGSFTERLQGRPLTWLVDPAAPTAKWLETFDEVRRTLAAGGPFARRRRGAAPDFYRGGDYLKPASAGPAIVGGQLDLRRPGRKTVLVVPERLAPDILSPCAYIRLLQPLDHPQIREDMQVVLAEPGEALRYRVDVVACQRHSVTEPDEAKELVAHCRATGARLLYDLDDDLIGLPPEHADYAALAPRIAAVTEMVRSADAVWVATAALRERIAAFRQDVRVVPNGLDERLWRAVAPPERLPFGSLRLLFMGTATHDADFRLVLPALERLRAEHGDRFSVHVAGFTARSLPDWIERVVLPTTASGSYPAFVNWMIRNNVWDVGLAPLLDTPFNRCKSSIKTVDYAGLGLATLASEISVYRGSLADGDTGWLVQNTEAAWHDALARLMRDTPLVQRLRQRACHAFADHSLAAQAAERRRAWADLATIDPARADRSAVAA